MTPINSIIERQFSSYLSGLNIANVDGRVYRFFNGIDAITPCIFVMARDRGSVIGASDSGIFRVPFQVRVVYVAQQIYQDPDAIDALTSDVEEALEGAQAAINSDATSELYLFDITMRSTPTPEVVEHTFQYGIELEVVCKRKPTN